MKVNARQYAESLNAASVGGKHSAQELVEGLLAVLAKKRQRKLTKKILEQLVAMEAVKKGRVGVVIETATPVEKATEKLLLKKAEELYPGVKVDATFITQPELGSGFRIRGKDKQLDQSFSTHLAELRNQLTHL
jgi:F0F1-type ATP synthase delta subunit